jgi:hypothetical protein
MAQQRIEQISITTGFAQKVDHQIGEGTEPPAVASGIRNQRSAIEEVVYEK